MWYKLTKIATRIAEDLADFAKRRVWGKEYDSAYREHQLMLRKIEDIRDMFGNALMEAKRNGTKGERALSIVKPFTDVNGTLFENAVLLDTQFFNGLSPRNWGQKLKIYAEDRSTNSPLIMPIVDENGKQQQLVFARKSDVVSKNGGSTHKALGELYKTSDNISKLSVMHIDEIVEVSEENNPYYTNENSHGWFDKNGWLHRNANVINAQNGAIYNITFDIAKTADGRTVLYATKGKIKKVGQAKLNSLVIRGSTPHSNFNKSANTLPMQNASSRTSKTQAGQTSNKSISPTTQKSNKQTVNNIPGESLSLTKSNTAPQNKVEAENRAKALSMYEDMRKAHRAQMPTVKIPIMVGCGSTLVYDHIKL